MIKGTNIRSGILIFAFLLYSYSCETEGYQIPYAELDLHLNIISELGNIAPGSYILYQGGVNGLIIYREDYGLFRVFDRTCSLYPDHNVAVEEDSTFIGIFTCPECNSQFLVSYNGEPVQEPALFGLKEYYSVVEGDLLHIYN